MALFFSLFLRVKGGGATVLDCELQPSSRPNAAQCRLAEQPLEI